MNLNNLTSSIGIKGTIGSDLLFLILFFAVSAVVSFILGKHRVQVSLLGVYIAYVVVSFANFDFLKDPQMKALLFLALLVGFIIFFSNVIRGSIHGSGPILAIKLIIGALIVVGLSLSIILNWYSSKELMNIISPNAKLYFTLPLYRFLWGIAPLVYIGIVRKRMH